GRWRGGGVQATSLAAGARGKSNVVEQLRERPPLNMLPACLATHRAARSLPVNDDPVAAGRAAILGPLAPPASPRRSHPSLALARLDDQHLLAIAVGSGGCGYRSQRNRHCVTFLALRPE